MDYEHFLCGMYFPKEARSGFQVLRYLLLGVVFLCQVSRYTIDACWS